MGVLDDLLKKTKEAARKNAKTRAAGKKKKKKASVNKKQEEQKKSYTHTRNIDRVRGSRKTTSAPSSKPEEEKKRDASAAWDKFGRSTEGGGLRESMRPVEEDKRNVDTVALQGNTGRTREELERIDTQRELAPYDDYDWLKANMQAVESRNKNKGVGPMAVPDPELDTQFDFREASVRQKMSETADTLIQNWDKVSAENRVDTANYILQAYGFNDQTRGIIMDTYKNASDSDKLKMLETAVYIDGQSDDVKAMQDMVNNSPTIASAEIDHSSEAQSERAMRTLNRSMVNDYRTYQEQQKYIDRFVEDGRYSRGDALKFKAAYHISNIGQNRLNAFIMDFSDWLRQGQDGYDIGFTDNKMQRWSESKNIFDLAATVGGDVLHDLFSVVGLPVSMLSKLFLDESDLQDLTDFAMGLNQGYMDSVALENRIYESANLSAVDRFALDTMGVVIEMIPTILMSIAGTPTLGMTDFATSAAGASARQAYEQGATLEESVKYGLSIGTAEAMTEKMFTGFGYMGKGFIAPFVRKLIPEEKILTGATRRILQESGFMDSVSYRIMKGVIASGGEATEEMVMEVVTPYIERATYNPEAMNATISEIGYAGGLGAMAAAVMGLPVTITDVASAKDKSRTYDQIVDDYRQRLMGQLNEAVASGEMTAEEAKAVQAEAEDILAGKGSLNVSDAVPEEKVAGEALDTVYDTYEDAKKVMMQEARTKKDGEKITANYIDNGVVKTFTTTAKGGTLGLGRSTEAGKEYQRIAQAKNVTERSGYQLNVKEDIIKEVSSLSKAIGREVEFYRNDDATDHGYMDKKTGKIYINAGSSQSAARSVIAHELTHQMENTAGWSKLVELMKKHYGSSYESRRQERIDAYEASGKPLKVDETRKTYDEADQELVAMFVEEKLLTDADTIREVVNTDKTLAQKIIAWINKVIQKLAGSKEQKMLVEARDLWNQALQEEQSGNKKAPKEGAGERHSFGGVNARTADLKALENAKDMLAKNHSAVDIFRETGWFVGADGKWRFEIDDSNMSYHKDGKKGNPDQERQKELYAKMFDGSITQEEMQELSLLEKNGVKKQHQLEDYIDHQALFEAYPELRTVELQFRADMEGNEKGSYSPDKNIITISSKLKNAPEETLVHEIQHAIQKIENFSGGSSAFGWAVKDVDGNITKRFADEYAELRKGLSKEDSNRYARYEDLSFAMDQMLYSPDAMDEARYERYEKESDDLYSELYHKPWFLRLNDLKRLMENDGYRYRYLYTNSAGEIEARDAASRRNMTAEERRNRMPDTGDENTVFPENATKKRAPELKVQARRYSISPQFKKDIRQIKKNIKNKKPNSFFVDSHLMIGDTPEFLQQFGFDVSKPLLMTSGHAKDILMPKDPNNTQYHGLTAVNLINALSELNDPVLVISSVNFNKEEDGTLMILTSELDANNIPIGIYVYPVGKGNYNRIEISANFVKTAFGRDNTTFFIEQAVKENRLLYENKRKSQQLRYTPGVYFPSNIPTVDFKKSITRYKDLVNKLYRTNRNSIGKFTDAEYLAAVNRGDMTTAQRMVDEAAKVAGYGIKAYHGTRRADRVGNKFLPERATSGPMAFFTSDRQIAENYAKDKADTSLAYDEEYADYYSQFRVMRSGKSVKVQDLWKTMSFAEKQRVKNAGAHITFDEDGENIVWDENIEYGLGNWDAYTLNMHRGNAIEALIDSWLVDGNLYGRERDFVDVLKLAGIDNVEYRDPDVRHEKVYDTYLSFKNPFSTDMVDDDFVQSFEEWYENQPVGMYERESNYADMWDKNNISADDFAERMRRDIENNSSNAWTSIPDSMTDYLKYLGYDGIYDMGGKYTGEIHTVYIPFDSNQIKSAETVTYDEEGNIIPLSERFNESNDDIRWSVGEKDAEYMDAVESGDMGTAQRLVREAANIAGFTSPKLHHGTKSFGFTQLRTKDLDIFEWSPFFATPDPNLAETYSGETERRQLRGGYPKATQDQIDEHLAEYYGVLKKRIRAIDKHLGKPALPRANDAKRRSLMKDARNELANMVEAQDAKTLSEAYNRYIDAVDALEKTAMLPAEEALFEFDEVHKARWEINRIIDAENVFVNSEGKLLIDENREQIESDTAGIYSFYANLDGLLEIDGEGKNWNRIDGSKIGKEGYAKTRDVALYAKENGYTGVIIKNIYDSGGQTDYYEPGDIYIFFEPASQVKSADTVTYDDNNEVIPLSERFNEENNDIRWSVGSVNKELQEMVKTSNASMRDVFHNRRRADHKKLWDMIRAEELHIVQTGAVRRDEVDKIVQYAYETGYINNAAEEAETGENVWGKAIYVPEEYKGEIASLGGIKALNNQLRGSGMYFTHKKGAGGLDEAYSDLQSANPILPDTIDPAEQMEAIVDLFGKNDTRRTLEELDEEAYAMGEEDAPYRNEIKQVVESALDDISVMARYKMTQDARKKGVSEGIERGKKAGVKEQQRKQLQADRQNLSVYDKLAKQRTKDERKDAEATMRMHDKLIESVRKEEKKLSNEDKKKLQKLYKSKEKDWNKELKRQASEFKKEQRKNIDLVIKQAEKERKDLERKLTAPQKKEMQKKQKDLDKARREERIRTAYNEYKRNSKPSEGSIESIYAKSKNARSLAVQMRRDIIKKIVELGKFTNANGMVVLDENGMEIAAQNLETGEWDVSKHKNTYTPPFGLTLLAEKEGMDKDVFYTIYSKIAELRSAKDENGKRLHKKEDVIEYISMLDLSVKQKNFLYFDVAKYPYTKMPTFLAGGSIKEKAGNKRGGIIEAVDNIALDMFRGTVKDSQVFTSEDDTVQIQNEDLLNIADIVFGKEQSEEKEDFIYYLTETVLNYATQMENIRLIEKTNLLTNKPKEKNDIKAQVLNAYREAKKLFIAEGEAFERMSDKMDDILITARYYAAKKAPAIANEMIFGKTQRDLKGEYKGKSLYEIFKPIFRADEKAKNDKLMTELTELVNCRHDIYRLRNGKGYTNYSIEECEEIVARISEEHPELLKAADELADYGRNLLRMCVESGRISQADYDYFTTKYPYYVPTFRVRSNEYIDRKGNVVRRDSKVIRTAKGGNEDVLPLFDQFVHRTQEIVKACKKNQLATEMVRHINVPGMEEYISEVRIAENQENKDSSIADIGNIEDVGIARREDGMGNVIPWYSNGKKYDIVVRDKNLLYGWDRINYRREEASIETALRKMNNIRRGVLTQYNPTFWITNSIKDYQDMYLYNQHAQWLPVYHAIAAKTMFGGTTGVSKEAEERLQEYLSFGMSHASIFEYDNTTAGRRSKKTRTKEALTKPIELFDTLNFMTEQTPRFAVYLETYERLKEKQYKKGGNTLTDEEIKTIALYRAEDATLNFGRSGTVVKYMNTYGFTFINAGVQGMDRFRRMFVQVKDKDKKTMFINIVGLLMKMELFGVTGGIILSFLYGGDDEWSEALREFLYGENADKVKQAYEEMDDYQKLNYYPINIGGVWIKIPRGRLAAFLYGPVYYGEKVQDGEMDMKELVKAQLDLASETILFSNPVTNNIAGPFIDVMLRNKDHWGNPIVSEYEDMGEGFHYLEYDEETTDLAIAVADALRFWDLSPKKMDYIIEQYLGSYSDLIMPFLSKGQNFGDRAMDMLMSLAGKFYIDPTSNNRLAGDYYDLKEEYENIANASDGDSPYAVAVKFFNEDTEQLKYLRDQIKAINADTTISRRERLDEIAKLKEQMNIIYRDGVTGAEGILAYAMENYTSGADVNELYDAWIRDNMSAEWRVAHFNDTEMERYNKITNAGCSSDNAVKAMDALAVLKPLDGESSVSDYQQVEAIAKLKLPAEEEVGAMAAVFNEKGYAKYTSMTPYGVTAQTWLDFEDALKEADKNNNGNGYYDNDEKQAALDSINASNSVRAVLWQSKDGKLGSTTYDTAWKAGRNPYDPGVASKMIDDYMAKIAGMEEEEAEKQYLPLSADYRISGEYGENRGDHIHSGIDLAIPEGSDVHAVMSGTVSFAGWKGGYGYRVVIDHPDGTQTAYSHLSDIGVKVGDDVDAGTVVALSGNTGYSTGPHLHFEVIEGGEYVNPEQYYDFGNGLKAEGDGNYVSQMSAVSGGYSGGGGGGGSSRNASTSSPGSRTSQVASNRRSGGGIYLPTASGSSAGRSGRSSSVAGMSTSTPTYGTRGVYLPKASDYTSGGSSIRSSVATTQRTGRTGGSFWNENILS